ncbi:hypothetical protein GTW51_19805 [Aurantimonas aggregata]|uniref:Integrase n=1 Tax=Aurantimonas aggregata TaxID=2047720 RepID=A0A6L9MM78_9HYPH|nr:hypothetical protein [Aurantimonas aggregata]NDV88933.1 hypothetical protein [Aurantimonas aggregata]
MGEGEDGSPRRSSSRGPGPHLVRCGTSYLFQIRLPIELGGGRAAPPIRIGIGARPAGGARRMADILAAAARTEFSRIKARRMSGNDDADNEPQEGLVFPGDDPREVVAEIRGYLKGVKLFVDREPPEPWAEQAAAFAGLRGLVGIAREIEKGPDGNPVIVENVDLLKGKYVDQFAGTAMTPVASAAPTVPAPAAAAEPSLASVPPAAAPAVSSSYRVEVLSRTEPRQFDQDGKVIPAFLLDRRIVVRRASEMPPFSEVSDEYLAARLSASPSKHRDISTARFRRDLFIQLIGDHPVDTYNAADLQAYIHLLSHWPAEEGDRRGDWTARQIIENNRDLHLKPIGLSTFRDGYVGTIGTMMRHKMATLGYSDPFAGAKIRYPETATPKRSAEPLASEKISRLFRTGVEGGLLDEAMLPLLGHLTGRRLGLLIHLQGRDIREKFRNVYVAETSGIVFTGGVWKRVPYKTAASTSYFVLHPFLKEIGFVDWAMEQEEDFLFPEIMRLVDPSKSASSYMQRLFRKAGIEKKSGEVFHSLRGGSIDEMRDEKVDGKIRRIQVGHTVGSDEHEGYGRRSLSEKASRQLNLLPLNPEIDFSMFHGLQFDVMAKRKRTRGRRPKS